MILLLSSHFEVGMKVAPELLDLIVFFHSLDNLDSVARLMLLLHFVPAQDFFIFHMAHALEMIDNPLVEMVSPVVESMRTLSVGFARSMHVSRGLVNAQISYARKYLPSKIEASAILGQDMTVSVSIQPPFLFIRGAFISHRRLAIFTERF